MAWVLSFLPLLPILLGKMGQFGLECKTRVCTMINADQKGDPTPTHPKDKIGIALIMVAILLLALNLAIYMKVRVTFYTLLNFHT